jgi:membrane associated rhomboid family serine protease
LEDNRLNFRDSFLPPLYFTLFLWFVHLAKVWLDKDWSDWGIYPREAFGLKGILFAPFLHADWGHLASNSIPFLVLATMIIYFYPRVALRAFTILYFVTGILVWLFARADVYHIGLSYVVYGLVSFVFWTGIFRRSIRSIILALIVISLYSGMFEGVLPTAEILRRNISWESHLIGAIVGVFVAYFYKEELEDDEKEHHHYADEVKAFYFDRTVFDKTLAERRYEEEQTRIMLEDEYRRQQLPPQSDWTSNSTY